MWFLYPTLTFSQKIDNVASYRAASTDSYFRFSYDNDYFTATDYYYTQGYSLEVVNGALKKNPLSKLLAQLDSATTYGLSFEHVGFTPTSIRHPEILADDRPFAAFMILKSFKTSINPFRQTRLGTTISIGVIGPAAFGGKMQSTIHRWIGGVEPQGWQNQISNDIILSYELNHEKILYNNRIVSVNSNANVRAGSLNTRAQAGATFILGKHVPELSNNKKPKFQFYIYTQPLANIIAYDATLQGGLFNQQSPYTIKSSQLSRITLQNNYGAILKLNNFYLEYSQTILSKEFKTGRQHKWGGVRLGFSI